MMKFPTSPSKQIPHYFSTEEGTFSYAIKFPPVSGKAGFHLLPGWPIGGQKRKSEGNPGLIPISNGGPSGKSRQ